MRDNSKEIPQAADALRINLENSQLGMPQPNGRAERHFRDILVGTRTALVAAGMPAYFWAYASRCFCFNWNKIPFSRSEAGPHLSLLTRGQKKEELKGNLTPFGFGPRQVAGFRAEPCLPVAPAVHGGDPRWS